MGSVPEFRNTKTTYSPLAQIAPACPPPVTGRRRAGRAAAATGLALTAALLLSACTSGGDAGHGASSPNGTGGSASQSEPVYAAHPAETRLQVKALDLATYLPQSGLEVASSMEPRFHGTWPASPVAPAFGEELAREVDGEIQRWLEDQTTPTDEDRARADAAGRPATLAEVNIQPDLTAAGSDVAAVRLFTSEFAGASSGSSYRTVWYDAGRAAKSRDLFTDSGWTSLHSAAEQKLKENPRTYLGAESGSAGADIPAPTMGDKEMDSINFTRSGDVVIEFDEYAVAAGDAGPIEVVIPAGEAKDWLSPFGQRAQKAAENPSPLKNADGSTPTESASTAAPTPLEPESTESAPSAEPTDTDPTTSAAPTESQGENPGAGSDPTTTEPSDKPSDAPEAPASTPAAAPQPSGAVDCQQKKCVALTFDDGPGPYTGALLDSLKARNVPATFFVLGPNVAAKPDLVKRMAAEGHQVANHTWSHLQLPRLSAQQLTSEIQRTADQIRQATGTAPTVMRPPYGALDAQTRQRLSQMNGTGIILWSVDTLDWKTKNVAATLRSVKQQVRPGGIILMHDIHKASVQAAPQVVDWLTSQGYTLVTVDQLLGSTQSGKAYSNGPRP